MKKRPLTVTIIAWLLIATGVTGFAYHLNEVKPQHALQDGNIWIFVVEVVAMVCGVLLLRGGYWARWLAMAWITFHLAISFFDSLSKVAVHALILLLFAYCLFHPAANAYFRRQEPDG